MFGFLKDIAEDVGDVLGTTVAVATAPIAIALGVSECAVKAAVRSGCKTQREIKAWIDENWDD